MLKIKWSDKITNEEVLNRIGNERCLLKDIISRRVELVRHQGLLKSAMEGTVESKGYKGTPRLQYIKHIIDDVNHETYDETKRKAQGRSHWKTAGNQSYD